VDSPSPPPAVDADDFPFDKRRKISVGAMNGQKERRIFRLGDNGMRPFLYIGLYLRGISIKIITVIRDAIKRVRQVTKLH